MAAQTWHELQELRLLSSFDIRVRETRSQILDLEADQRDRCIRLKISASFLLDGKYFKDARARQTRSLSATVWYASHEHQ